MSQCCDTSIEPDKRKNTTVSALMGSLANGNAFIALQLVTFFSFVFYKLVIRDDHFLHLNKLGNAYCLQSD